MAPQTNRVRVPKSGAGTFNRNRPIGKNSLLANQVKHLHELELALQKQLETGIRFEDVRTEGDAAEYIRRVTAIFHPHLVDGERGDA
jgi:hypothetical protein